MGRKCLDKNCKKKPSYGDRIDRKPLYCVKHCPIDFIDVVSKRCIDENCDEIAVYGIESYQQIHCIKHKNPNEFLRNKPKCVGDTKCKERPCYTNRHNNIPIRCETHKLSDDLNIIERPCEKCGLPYYLLPNKLCEICDIDFSKVKISEELIVKNLLDHHKISYLSHNKVLTKTNSRIRPDFIILHGDDPKEPPTHITVLEVDEFQHKNYQCPKDQRRMIEIYEHYKIPVFFTI